MRELMETINQFLNAFSHLQLDKMMESFSEDATAFFPVKHHHLRLDGKVAITAAFARVIKNIRDSGNTSIRLESEDINIQPYNNCAIVTFHIRDNNFCRRTLVLHQTKNKWRIEHLHASNAQLTKTREV